MLNLILAAQDRAGNEAVAGSGIFLLVVLAVFVIAAIADFSVRRRRKQLPHGTWREADAEPVSP